MSSVTSAVGNLVSGITQPVASLASSAVSAAGNYFGAQTQNSEAQQNTADAEAYNTDMADTTYQRTVSDLESAGLNPMLALRGADPTATISAAPVVNELGAAMNNGISNYSAMQSAGQSGAAITTAQSQQNLNAALTAKAAADTTSALAASKVSNAQADKITSGSLLSDTVGSNMAAKTSQYLNSALDSATQKVSSLISGTAVNSAWSAIKQAASHPIDSILAPFGKGQYSTTPPPSSGFSATDDSFSAYPPSPVH